MEIKQLRYFHAVLQEGSIQRASARLYVSQQALSRAMRNLEEELGQTLFMRTSSGVIPTEEALLFARETAAAVAQIDEVVYSLRTHCGAERSRVTAGVLIGTFCPEGPLSYAQVQKFVQEHPEIELRCENCPPHECEARVLDGRCDFAFSSFPAEPERFVCKKLYEFCWRILVKRDHPLAQRPRLVLEDLAGQRLVMPGPEQYDRRQIMRALPAGRQPYFVPCDDTLFDILFQKVLGEGDALLMAEHHARLIDTERFRAVPFETDLLRNQVFLLIKKGAVLSPPAAVTLNTLLQSWGFSCELRQDCTPLQP